MSDKFVGNRGLLVDWEIRRIAMLHDMITPYYDKKQGNPSFGESTTGYDIRLGNKFKKYKKISEFHNSEPLRPGKVTEKDVTEFTLDEGEEFILEPNDFVLAESMETFDMPINVVGLLKDKSTYMRLAISSHNTVLESGWRGTITLEIKNENPQRSVALIPGMGILQVLFWATERPDNPYGNGKYQDQKGVTLPK